MQSERTFKVSSVRLALHLCLDFAGALLFGYYLSLFLVKVPRAVHVIANGSNSVSDIWLTVRLALVGVLFISLFLFLFLTSVFFGYVNYHLSSTSISVTDSGIEITNRSRQRTIARSDIVHIFKHSAGLTLVWKSEGSLMTFFVTGRLFGTRATAGLAELIMEHEGYIDDIKQIKQIKKELRLDHIFRRNRYEYQIAKAGLAKSVAGRFFLRKSDDTGGSS
jgi:hypothetical protein